MNKDTVSIKGTVYDIKTGNPIRRERSYYASTNHNARSIHLQTQKSTTLNRRYVHLDKTAVKPHSTAIKIERRSRVEAPSAINLHRKPATPKLTHSQSVAHISKRHKNNAKAISDIAPLRHALEQKVKARMDAKANQPSVRPVVATLNQPQVQAQVQAQAHVQPATERVLKPSQVLKQEAIADAMLRATPESKKSRRSRAKAKRTHQSSFKRFLSVASGSMAVLLLGAYFTYLSMPALSTRVAASQAGINATYPAYLPSGYSLSGPVAYQNGNVSMKFAANAGPQSYDISQTHTDWDSSALLNDFVSPQAGKSYITTSSGGLTIYSFDNTSVWVNNGILYTINGNTHLSDEQIQRIASSL